LVKFFCLLHFVQKTGPSELHLFLVPEPLTARKGSSFKKVRKFERNDRAGRLSHCIIDFMAKTPEDSYPTRSSLLGRLKDSGDQKSWQEFADIYSKLIFGFAMKAGLNKTEAQEVVQETLIAAAKNLPEFRYDPKVCSFKTYLLNLSNWRVKDQLRKRLPGERFRSPEDDRTATVERVADPAGVELERIWDQEWHTALLEAASEKAKRQVDLKQWQIFDLYVLKNWPPREVAKALGVSVARVYLAKHRVSVVVRKEMEKLERGRSDI
jgi:RNA polymerase sigma-70 factor (ECF subfamily)